MSEKVKEKKICIVADFFIWIIIKNYWYDIKNVKKLKCFEADCFLKNENKIGELLWHFAKHNLKYKFNNVYIKFWTPFFCT
jgi:hypothetical protein